MRHSRPVVLCCFVILSGLGLLATTGCDDAATSPAEGMVRGAVSRIYSGDAIAAARVTLGGETVITETDGSFLLKRVVQGDAMIHVSADRYRDLFRVVTIGEYQFLDLELTPVDSIVSVVGRVRHRADGPLRAPVHVGDSVVWTDADGAWRLDDVPIGPLPVRVEIPGYNPMSSQYVVHVEEQFLEQVVTRDTTVAWAIEDDSFIYTRDDSLNANRGSHDLLIVSADLGRTAVFSLEPPSLPYAWAEIVGARLEVYGFLLAPPPALLVEPEAVSMNLSALNAPFGENAIDFAFRPAIVPAGTFELDLDILVPGETPDRMVSVDIVGIYDTVMFGVIGGAAFSMTSEERSVAIVSSDSHLTDLGPRAVYTYRF